MWKRSILPEEKSMKRWRLGALSLISATIAVASLVSAPPAAAEARDVDVYTTDKERGGFLRAKITFFPNGDGTYRSSITGRYEDRDADNYCVKAFRTGGRERYDLGPAACPEGKSQAFDYQYSKATKAAVMVCRVNNKTHQLANCSGWK
jgi:hypothetical protein